MQRKKYHHITSSLGVGEKKCADMTIKQHKFIESIMYGIVQWGYEGMQKSFFSFTFENLFPPL